MAGAYGRQLPHSRCPAARACSSSISCTGEHRRVQRLAPDEELTYHATLFSNVNAAIPRTILERYPFARGPDDERGPGVVASRPPGRASRSCTSRRPSSATRTRTRSRRRSGDSSTPGSRPSTRTSRATSRGRRCGGPGAATRARSSRWLWQSGRRRWIPYTVVYELGKFAGLQLGLHHERLPRGLARRLSAYEPND